MEALVRVITTFLLLYVYMDFSRRSKAANSPVRSQIWLKFELIRTLIIVLVTGKKKVDPIKNEGARVLTSLYMYIDFLDAQGQLTPHAVIGGITPKLKLNQTFMVVLLTCKNEDDPIK